MSAWNVVYDGALVGTITDSVRERLVERLLNWSSEEHVIELQLSDGRSAYMTYRRGTPLLITEASADSGRCGRCLRRDPERGPGAHGDVVLSPVERFDGREHAVALPKLLTNVAAQLVHCVCVDHAKALAVVKDFVLHDVSVSNAGPGAATPDVPDSTVAEPDDVSSWDNDPTSDFARAFDVAVRAELLAEMSRTGTTIGEVARSLNVGQSAMRARLKGTTHRLPIIDVAAIAFLVGTPVYEICRRAMDAVREAAS